MASLSQIPTSNVQIADVRDTLNANGGSVSNDTTTFFTTSAKKVYEGDTTLDSSELVGDIRVMGGISYARKEV